MNFQRLIKINLLISIFAVSLLIPQISRAQNTPSGCYDTAPGSATGSAYIGPLNANGTCTIGYPAGPNGVAGTAADGNINYTPLEPISTNTTPPRNFCELLNLLFKALIYIGGMIAVLFLVIGGIGYMVSEVVDKRTVARNRIKAAFWGLGILLISWIVLNTVNPQLVNICTVLAPANAFGVLTNPPPTTSTAGCIGTSSACLTPQEQAAIDDVRRNGVFGATEQDVLIAGREAVAQQQACVATPGNSLLGSQASLTVVGVDGKTGCQRNGYTSCTLLAGAGNNMWCVH